MRKEKILSLIGVFSIFTLSVFTLALFCGCSNEAVNGEKDCLVEIETVVYSSEKLLNVTTPQNIKKFEYRATPLFEEDDDLETPTGKITGDTEGEWKSVRFQDETGEDAFIGKLRAVMGYYRQGRWEIELRALNADGDIVYTSTTGTVYFNANKRNAFSVELRGEHTTSVAAAKLNIVITGLETEENKALVPLFVYEYTDGVRKEISEGWTTRKVQDGVMEYTLYREDLEPGEVYCTLSLSTDGGSLQTAESFKTILINGSLTEITGTMESGAFIHTGFVITEDKSEVKGRIVAGEGVTESLDPQRHFIAVQSKDDAVFTFEQDASDTGGSDYTVTWYVDGVRIGEGVNLLFSRTQTAGNYLISAEVRRNEKVFTTDVVLVLMPEEV